MTLYEFPQRSAPLSGEEKGIATLSHPEVGTFRFRSNPKEFNWSYTLTKRVDQTYGGRVIQLLGTRIEDFVFKADCGTGRWEYMNRVARFMGDVMIRQRGGRPATFEYTTRGWKFNAYLVNVPFADAVEEVLREFEVQMKVQEDVSGLISKNTLSAEMRRLQEGLNFQRSKYNDPEAGANSSMINRPTEGPIVDGVRTSVTQAQNFIGAAGNAVNSTNNLVQTLLNVGGQLGNG